ncbi:hypothetical protein [Roseimaritima sediminicola]|uniref:hypothetical protein n=1 Tax=Roseimaritima sediminicola TaxID=2662066 RepID=UPI001298349D|nr:hypothetical protein [Roseimaritima sediminicola]
MTTHNPVLEAASAVEAARESLLSQLEPVEREAAALKERLAAIEQTRDQLEAAIKALTPDRKPKSRGSRKPSKPFAKKADVHAVCLALVEANAPIAKADLESLAKHKLSEDLDFSLSGVSLRLSECLRSEDFNISPEGLVSLSADTAAPHVKTGS